MARKYLKEMKMPEKKKEPMLEMEDADMQALAEPAGPSDEMDMEEMSLEDGEEAMPNPLADISDEDIMAEAEKRGMKIVPREEAPEEEMELEEVEDEQEEMPA